MHPLAVLSYLRPRLNHILDQYRHVRSRRWAVSPTWRRTLGLGNLQTCHWLQLRRCFELNTWTVVSGVRISLDQTVFKCKVTILFGASFCKLWRLHVMMVLVLLADRFP